VEPSQVYSNSLKLSSYKKPHSLACQQMHWPIDQE